jgi:hypothetical protein
MLSNNTIAIWAAFSGWFRTLPGSFNTARRTIQGYEAMNMIRKGQIKDIEKGDVIGQISFINEIFGVAA